MNQIPIRTLTSQDVDLRRSRPTDFLIRDIAGHVVRNGSQKQPGIIVIPNTRDIVASQGKLKNVRRKIDRFQINLMKQLDAYLATQNPKVVRMQRHVAMPATQAAEYYRNVNRGIRELSVEGRGSAKFPHMDSLAHIFVSLCYMPRRNTRGGTPRFLDLLAMAEEKTSGDLHRLLELETNENAYIYHPKELYARLNGKFGKASKKFMILIRGLDFNKFPIIVFTNRLEDAILHGATRARKRNPNVKRWERPISYVAIGHS